jgi:hypothetical protein
VSNASLLHGAPYGFAAAAVGCGGWQRSVAVAVACITSVDTSTIEASYSFTPSTATAGSGGSISPSGSVFINYGASQIFTITANAGYHVSGVLVDGVSVGVVSSYIFSDVQADHSISASFAVNTYPITASAGTGGTITPKGTITVNHGANQAFTIKANTGYHIADVLVDGSSVGAVTSYTFTNVQAVHTITASFARNAFTITVTQRANGVIAPGTTSVSNGASQTFTITPNTGYHIGNVVVDGVPMGAITSYTFTNVQANHSISVKFARNS